MKKLFSLLMALCLLCAALPVVAKTPIATALRPFAPNFLKRPTRLS